MFPLKLVKLFHLPPSRQSTVISIFPYAKRSFPFRVINKTWKCATDCEKDHRVSFLRISNYRSTCGKSEGKERVYNGTMRKIWIFYLVELKIT